MGGGCLGMGVGCASRPVNLSARNIEVFCAAVSLLGTGPPDGCNWK